MLIFPFIDIRTLYKKYFKPHFMSLQVPHSLWLTCGTNSYEICKATIQAKMLSGRYRTDHLLRHFTDNDGSCTLCKGDFSSGSIEHLLIYCPALVSTRKHLHENLKRSKNLREQTKSLILSYFQDGKDTMQLLLDGSALPEIIRIRQTEGKQILHEIFSFSRNWCYTIHKTRLKLQGRWIN